jgi:hypothetical protein
MTVGDDALAAIQSHFHELIRTRATEYRLDVPQDLPQLREPLPTADDRAYFAVPGMYGGFSYRCEGEGPGLKLISESWSRIVGGSGQRHLITADGVKLVEKGFV